MALAGAPYYRRLVQNRSVRAFVQGVTVAGAAFILGRRTLIDLPTVLISLAVLTLIVTARKIPEPLLILGAGMAGLALFEGH